MKNKNIGKSLLILLLLLLTFEISAQTDESNPLPQFLFQKFSRGAVQMKAGKAYSGFINYNMVDEEMVFEQKGQYMALDKPENIDTVFIGNRTFVPVGKAFYEVLSKGTYPIFLQNKSKYVPVGATTAYGLKSQTLGTTAVSSMQTGNQVRNLDVPENVTISAASVNWVRKNNVMEKFTNERQFIKLFPEKEAELNVFFKKEKLNFKVREDLVKLGTYFNELMK